MSCLCWRLCTSVYTDLQTTGSNSERTGPTPEEPAQTRSVFFLALCRLSTDRPGTTSAARLIRYSLCCKTAKYSNLIHTLHVCVLAGWSSVCSLTLFVSVSVFFWLIDTHTHTQMCWNLFHPTLFIGWKCVLYCSRALKRFTFVSN